MKKRLLLCILASTALRALEPGKNYDFYQKNGQNVLGAELIEESESEYTVKLKYVPKPIKLAKGSLAENPVLSKVQPPSRCFKLDLKYDFAINASAGTNLAFGRLGNIFPLGYEARAGIDWFLFEKTRLRIRALSALASFAAYQSAARHIQLASAFIGTKFMLWHFTGLDAALFATPLIGATYADLRGYTFAANYTALSAAGVISFEKRWNTIGFAVQLYVNSLFDTSLNLASSGISLAVCYPLGSATLF